MVERAPSGTLFLKRIGDLKPLDEQGARAIVADVGKAAFSDLAVETLIKPLAEALDVSIPAARKFWKDAASVAREAAALEAVRRADQQRSRASGSPSSSAGPPRRTSAIGCGPHAGRSPKARHCSPTWKSWCTSSAWSAKAHPFGARILPRQAAFAVMTRSACCGAARQRAARTFSSSRRSC
jgi:hypothetical protein